MRHLHMYIAGFCGCGAVKPGYALMSDFGRAQRDDPSADAPNLFLDDPVLNLKADRTEAAVTAVSE